MDLHVVPYTAIYFAVEYPTGVRDNFIEVLFSPMSLAHCLAGETRVWVQPSIGKDMSGEKNN